MRHTRRFDLQRKRRRTALSDCIAVEVDSRGVFWIMAPSVFIADDPLEICRQRCGSLDGA
jgi:hypothetical protein